MSEQARLSRRRLLANSATLAIGFPDAGLPHAPSTLSALSAVPRTGGGPLAVPIPQPAGLPPEAVTFAADWPLAQGNASATRSAAGSAINAESVARLSVAWELPLDADSGYGAITSNPIVAGDMVYIVDQLGNVQAIERETGNVAWRRDYNVPTVGPNGVALGDGALVSVLGDTAEVVALDPRSGAERWRGRLMSQAGIGVTMAPLIYDGCIFVGTEPGGNSNYTYEGGAAGTFFCLDLQSGATRWQWDTTTDDLWGNPEVNSGGGVWYPPSVDENGVLYLGIGNAGPFPGTNAFPNGSSRPGPNDYANCLVALDSRHGALLWFFNIAPHDLFDHDNQLTPVLATASIGGSERDIVVSSGKHGYVVAVDRQIGRELWRTAVGVHENDELRMLPSTYVRVAPGMFGGVESPLAYADGVIFATALNFPTEYNNVGYNFASMSLDSASGEIVALDAATGATKWNVAVPSGLFGAGPTIANDVVFIGALDGLVRGYDTADGRLIWSHQLGAGMNAPFAIAGDMLLVPAGAFLVAAAESDVVASPAAPSPALVAFRLQS